MRRVAAAVVLAALALAAVVALGRWEGERALDAELRELDEAFAAAGGRIDSERLSAYRLGPPDCLLYASGDEPYAIQLCFDREGRLVEAVDRLGAHPSYASIVRTPEKARVRVERARLDALLGHVAETPP